MEATYSSTHFRSRLEARWAVVFDLLEWDWDYEPCHYPVGHQLGYLPDFYLPDAGLWAEVKGAPFFDRESMAKVAAAVGGRQPLPLRQAPYGPTPMLLVLGPVRPSGPGQRPVHTAVLPGAREGTAELVPVTLAGTGIEIAGASWRQIDASGVPAARRPSKTLTEQILSPGPISGVTPEDVRQAYRVAAALEFDADGQAIIPAALREHLSQRRAGRPLVARRAPLLRQVA